MRSFMALYVSLLACGAPSSAPDAPPARTATTPTPTAAPPAPATKLPKASMPTPEDIWSRVATDFTACYDTGHKAVPEMLDGRITFHAAIDAAGKSTCVVPGDDSGLTQDVEDCMRERLTREAYPANPAEWSTALPVVLHEGHVSLGKITKSTSIDTINSLGLSAELYDIVEGLLPDTKDCLRGIEKGTDPRIVVVVGAQVGNDGAVKCALASSTSPIPAAARRCVADVFGKARFRPPKRGYGLLSVPIEIVRRGS